jgi:hypothetical protein
VIVWLLTFNFIHFMAAFWAAFTFGGSGPAITAHNSLDLKQKTQTQIQIWFSSSGDSKTVARGLMATGARAVEM